MRLFEEMLRAAAVVRTAHSRMKKESSLSQDTAWPVMLSTVRPFVGGWIGSAYDSA